MIKVCPDCLVCFGWQLEFEILEYLPYDRNKCAHIFSMVEIILLANKVWNTFLSLFSNNMLLFRTGNHKMDVRIAVRDDPDQTASLEAV